MKLVDELQYEREYERENGNSEKETSEETSEETKTVTFNEFLTECEIPNKEETWPYGPVLGFSATMSPEFRELYDYSIYGELTVGSAVHIDDNEGILRFKGYTEFAEGEWYGIELTEP
eukprot:Awhi_evm1s8669